MKPPSIELDDVLKLPLIYRETIPESYRDENGHTNMRYYLAIYDEAGYPLMKNFGMTDEFREANQAGGFDLEHHIHYLREVHIGDTVGVRVRVVGRTPKRIHYMMFMVNETRGELASLFECVNSFADLSERKTAPFPDEIAAKMDVMLSEHQALNWEAPICGVMRA